MSKITVLVLDDYRHALIKELHDLGTVEIKEISKNKKEGFMLSQSETDERLGKISHLLTRTERVLETLTNALKEKEQAQGEEDVAVDEADRVLNALEASIKKIEDDLLKVNKDIEYYSLLVPKLEKIKEFEFNLSDIGDSEYISVLCGEILTEAFEKLPDAVVALKKEHPRSIIAAICLNEDKGSVYSLLRRCEFEEFSFPKIQKKPGEVLEDYNKKISELAAERNKIALQMEELAEKNIKTILVLREKLGIEKERLEIQKRFLKTSRVFMFEGFVPAKNVDLTVKAIERKYGIVSVEEPKEPEKEIPVLLENPALIKPFEVLVENFAMPSYTEMDPTFLMAVAFPVFFGIMLNDAGYGIMLFALAYFVYTHFASKVMKSIGTILMISSFPAIFVGLLTGSVFGDFFQRFIGIKFGRFNIFERATAALLITWLLGAVHVNIGLLIGIKRKLEKKNFSALISEHLWIVFLELGVLLLGLHKLANTPIAVGLVFLGLTGIIILKYYGPLGIIRVTGILGTVLSYSRLFGYAMAGTAIAMTINLLSQMLSSSAIGMLLAALLMIGGHLFAFALTIFGAFAHSMRLHYLEFFGMFYEGEGKKFMPFKANREYTKKEVKQW